MTNTSNEAYWPADTSVPVLDISTGDALRRATAQTPDRLALVEAIPDGWPSPVGAASTHRSWTYRQLLGAAQQGAHWLLTRFQPGDHVCLWAPNVAEWVIVQHAVALAGMVLVTANPALRVDELRYVLRQSRAVALFHIGTFRGSDMASMATEVATEVREIFDLANWWAMVRSSPDSPALPTVASRAPAQLQYTSGTTGQPKGALLHHMGLVTNASFVARRLGLNGDVLVSPMPLFHTAGSVLSVLGCVTTCSTLVLPLAFDPGLVLAAVEGHRARVLFGVPTMLIALIEAAQRLAPDLSSLQVVSSGGAPVPPELSRRVREWLGCELLAVYGQTEASPIISQTALQDHGLDRTDTAGKPLWQVEVRIVDPGTGRLVPRGIEGEIQARGYQTMLQYFDMPDATAQALLPDGWLRTGYLGTLDERGYLRVTGRLKDMIIRGGENIYPAEIESCLMSHESVANAAVFGLPDAHWGEIVAAAIQLRNPQHPPTIAALHAHCRTSLAAHKTPVAWFGVEQWPMTGSGKVQKFRLRDMACAGDLVGLDHDSRAR